MEEDEEDEEDMAGIVSDDEDGNPLPPLAANDGETAEKDSSGAEVKDNSSSGTTTETGSGSATPLSRAQMKNPRLRKGGKRVS